jgi:antibiotic biosynthesis monooxygenase (ABM) superfamily enzyme
MGKTVMDSGAQGVTSVIRHTIKPGLEDEYEEWLNHLAEYGHRFAGHQGANIIRPSEGMQTYTIIVRFDTVEHLQAWLASEVRLRLMKEVKPLLARRVEVDIQTGLDFWFTPPAPARAVVPSAVNVQQGVKPYKQFLVILSVIFPLEIIVHALLHPLSAAYPILEQLFIRDLLDAVVIVGALTFLIMPHYTRLLAKWLYS